MSRFSSKKIVSILAGLVVFFAVVNFLATNKDERIETPIVVEKAVQGESLGGPPIRMAKGQSIKVGEAHLNRSDYFKRKEEIIAVSKARPMRRDELIEWNDVLNHEKRECGVRPFSTGGGQTMAQFKNKNNDFMESCASDQ